MLNFEMGVFRAQGPTSGLVFYNLFPNIYQCSQTLLDALHFGEKGTEVEGENSEPKLFKNTKIHSSANQSTFLPSS